ncbi:MAG: decaprenyl-phosphate phosphoribosyltransferase [Gemmatimonadales bacterium]|nr:decaprenyl-phosphate phosphoribosyltransferase [Gemmatimonadales bacterium]
MKNWRPFLESLRPRQWTKNLLLFAGLIFAKKVGDLDCLARAVAGAAVFCLSSGVIYVLNDVVDRELDRLHPDKRNRPIASGRLPVRAGVSLGFQLLVGCLVAASFFGMPFLASVAFFFFWNWLYTRWLKKVPILDVTGIGMSFVIRAVAGVMVLLPGCPKVGISVWLLLCTFFLSLYLGFCKRRDEFMKVETADGKSRPVLRGYTEPMLDSLIGISLGLTMVMYSLYTVWPHTVAEFGTRNLVYTVPLVLLGLGRYQYLVYKEKMGGKPHEILLSDFILQVVVIFWACAAVWVIGI